MNQYLRKKISYFSFFLMILIILLHSQNISNRFAAFKNISAYNKFIQSFFSGGICQIGVPFFFIISGYLYFYNTTLTIDTYFKKTKKRINSLLIPFLLTSITTFIFFLIVQNVPILCIFINNKIQLHFTLESLLKLIIINPQSYQLWFLVELIIVSFFLVPLIYLLIKYLKGFYILSIIICWIFLSKSISWGIHPAITFFSVGAYLSINKVNLKFAISKLFLLVLLILWFCLIILHFYLLDNNNLFLNLSILVGIVVNWKAYDLFDLNKKIVKTSIFSFSFFLYLFHEPILTLIMKFIFLFFHFNLNVASFIAYLLAPTFTILFVLQLGIQLKKKLKYVYNLYTGNR